MTLNKIKSLSLAHKGWLLAAVLIVADQLTKWLAFEVALRVQGERLSFIDWLFNPPTAEIYTALRPEYFSDINVLPFFNLVMVWNKGVSFGLLSNDTSWAPALLAIFAALVGIGLLVWMRKTACALMMVALAFIASGALGNAWDRLRFGAVADFADFHVMGYHWPAFNLADSTIVIGAFLMIIDAFKNNNTAAALPAAAKKE